MLCQYTYTGVCLEEIPHLNSEDKQKKENLANEFFPFDHTHAASKLLVDLIKLWRPDPHTGSLMHS